MKYPEHIRLRVSAAERNGHRLVSQGCALFRCTLCGATHFLDKEQTFRDTCPLPPDHPAAAKQKAGES